MDTSRRRRPPPCHTGRTGAMGTPTSLRQEQERKAWLSVAGAAEGSLPGARLGDTLRTGAEARSLRASGCSSFWPRGCCQEAQAPAPGALLQSQAHRCSVPPKGAWAAPPAFVTMGGGHGQRDAWSCPIPAPSLWAFPAGGRASASPRARLRRGWALPPWPHGMGWECLPRASPASLGLASTRLCLPALPLSACWSLHALPGKVF